MEDQKIVALFTARSEVAIAETGKKYGRYCFSIANNILGNPNDANECVNDAFYRAWNSIPPAKPKILSAFLGKITRELAIDRWRKQSAKKRGGGQVTLALEELAECVPSSQNVERSIEKKELEDAICTFIGSLEQPEKNIFICRYWYCDEPSKIAEQYGMKPGTVRSQLHRTRKKLLEHLKGCGFFD